MGVIAVLTLEPLSRTWDMTLNRTCDRTRGSPHTLWTDKKKHYRVPAYTGKTGKLRVVFPVREFQNFTRKSGKSQGIFYQSGKIRSDNNILFYWESLNTVVSRHSFV